MDPNVVELLNIPVPMLNNIMANKRKKIICLKVFDEGVS
jgi:hypothetical protein